MLERNCESFHLSIMNETVFSKVGKISILQNAKCLHVWIYISYFIISCVRSISLAKHLFQQPTIIICIHLGTISNFKKTYHFTSYNIITKKHSILLFCFRSCVGLLFFSEWAKLPPSHLISVLCSHIFLINSCHSEISFSIISQDIHISFCDI